MTASLAHTENRAEELLDQFSDAACRFGLMVGLKKIEVMLQPANCQNYTTSSVRAGNVEFNVVDRFCYLGCVFSSSTTVDDNISFRLGKANVAFGTLSKRLWYSHCISIATKVAAYWAVVLTSILCACNAWTLYHHHIRRLDQFHMHCRRKIAHIKWEEHIPNTDMVKICHTGGIEAFLQTAQLRWCGHVIRMDDTHIPKQSFCGQLLHGSRLLGRQYKWYKDYTRIH